MLSAPFREHKAHFDGQLLDHLYIMPKETMKEGISCGQTVRKFCLNTFILVPVY